MHCCKASQKKGESQAFIITIKKLVINILQISPNISF